MLAIKLKTQSQIQNDVADAYKQQRLMKNMTRETLSKCSGVAVSTIKKFEETGKISLESFIMLSKALDKDDLIKELVKVDKPKTIEEFKNQSRKRARV